MKGKRKKRENGKRETNDKKRRIKREFFFYYFWLTHKTILNLFLKICPGLRQKKLLSELVYTPSKNIIYMYEGL